MNVLREKLRQIKEIEGKIKDLESQLRDAVSVDDRVGIEDVLDELKRLEVELQEI